MNTVRVEIIRTSTSDGMKNVLRINGITVGKELNSCSGSFEVNTADILEALASRLR
jgi:hypothetical protein